MRLSIIYSLGRRSALLALVCAAWSLAACGGGGEGGSGVRVVATTSQIGALTKEVAQGHVRLTVLMGPGVSAHDFEPDPGDVRAINGAALVLRNGIGLDDFLDRVIGGAGGSAKVVTVTEGIDLQRGAGEEGGSGDFDPHVWHDPMNAKVMVVNIAKVLAEVDPANAALYATNAATYEQKLDETDRQIRALIDTIPVDQRKMVTNHDAFGYFIRRYGLTYVGAVIPSLSSEAQPSAGDIAKLEDVIRQEGVKAIFAEAELDPKVARQISKDTGIKIVDDLYADSLGKPGSGADTVDGMLLANARKIAEALR
jgi:ABC-type Zn uptake system ZnuABC Zn-binding protein ZnuA